MKVIDFNDKKKEYTSLEPSFIEAANELTGFIIIGWDKNDEFWSDTNIENAEAIYLLELAKQVIIDG